MEGSYLPNNPGFLQDAWKSFSPLPGFEEPPDLDTPDMEPFANLFGCGSPYNRVCSPGLLSGYTKESKDADDMYAPLKPNLVHPGEQPMDTNQPSFSTQFPGASLFQPSSLKNAMEPEPAVASQAHVMVQGMPVTYPQIQVTGCGGGSGHVYGGNEGVPTPVFPAAMSVNLSMNMTMGLGEHFVGTASSSVPSNGLQWTLPSATYNASCSPTVVSGYGQPVQMPAAPGAAAAGSAGTYTFTAEFRPAEPIPLPAIEKEFASCNTHFKSMSGPFCHHPCKESPFMLKSKARSVPTGLAACFPAAVTPEAATDAAAALQDPDQAGAPSSKLNLCRICGKTYARPSTLKTHLRTHSGERPYRCGTCHKSFSQAANLTAHIRTHSGEKPFRCYVCDRRFSQSSSVTTHMRTHSGERPYRCYMCKKSFSDSSTLTKHLRIHSGEKPYQCKLCLLRFSQSGNLNRHMRIHAASI